MSGNPDSSSKIVKINTKNVYKIFESNELVVIIFGVDLNYAPKHSSIFEEVALKVSELYPDPGKVIFGNGLNYHDSSNYWIEYYSQSEHNIYFNIKPNVRFFINGKLATKCFSSDMTVSNLVSYIQTLLDDSIQEISNICMNNNPTKACEKVIIGYFKNKNTPDYQIFKKLSMAFMDNCQFYAGFGEEYCTTYPDRDHNKSLIIFKISNQPSPEFEQEIFEGNLFDFGSLYNWAKKNVLYSTSEITFDNSEETQKDHKVSIILFYNPDDLEPVKRFKDNIRTDLKEYCISYFSSREQINFLTANGVRFSKKLQEIEKYQTDLPFLLLVHRDAIYQFPENFDVNSMLSYQQLKSLIKIYFSNFDYYHCFNVQIDKSAAIHPIYQFNLFCEFSDKPPVDIAADNFCISLFDDE